jgi:uncharacterized membrane protein YciS (DUF1049 family)
MKFALWISATFFLLVTWMSESPMLGLIMGWILFGLLWCIVRLGQAVKSRGWV